MRVSDKKLGSYNTLDTNPSVYNTQLSTIDEITLSKFVAARLDLPVTKRLLDQNVKLSMIKQCWEVQLQIKRKLQKYNSF